MKRSKAEGGDVESHQPTNYSSFEDDAENKNDPAPIQETHMRSVLKGVTWRVVATSTTMLIAWFITGQVQLALEIGFIEVFAKIGIYYIHERIWAKIRV